MQPSAIFIVPEYVEDFCSPNQCLAALRMYGLLSAFRYALVNPVPEML